MTIPDAYTEITPFRESWDYETYDHALADWCRLLFVTDSRPIPIVFATPDRAFAQMKNKFKLPEGQPIPLPFLSIQQIGDSEPDPKRRLTPAFRMKVSDTYTDDGVLKGALTMQFPLAYNLLYSLEWWVRTRKEGRRFARQYAEGFEHVDYTYLTVDHGEGIGVKWVRMVNQGITDNSVLESGGDQRTLRWSATVQIEGWLPRRITEVPVVKRINVSVEDWKDS